MRHWALEELLLWMLVWRDTGEEQLGTGGILAVRTGPMGVPLVARHRALQRAGVTGHLQLHRWQTRCGAGKTTARTQGFGLRTGQDHDLKRGR